MLSGWSSTRYMPHERIHYCEQFTDIKAPGPVRAPPLLRDPVGHSSRPCDYEGGQTKKTGGGETTWVQRRTVEHR